VKAVTYATAWKNLPASPFGRLMPIESQTSMASYSVDLIMELQPSQGYKPSWCSRSFVEESTHNSYTSDVWLQESCQYHRWKLHGLPEEVIVTKEHNLYQASHAP